MRQRIRILLESPVRACQPIRVPLPAGAAEGGAVPVDRVDGDAAGGMTKGGVQQQVHETVSPGAAVA